MIISRKLIILKIFLCRIIHKKTIVCRRNISFRKIIFQKIILKRKIFLCKIIHQKRIILRREIYFRKTIFRKEIVLRKKEKFLNTNEEVESSPEKEMKKGEMTSFPNDHLRTYLDKSITGQFSFLHDVS